LDQGEVPDLEGFATKFRRKIMYAASKVVALKARVLAPDSGIARKGKLKRTIRYGAQDRGWEGYVKTKAPHAHLVHEGTAPHVIPAPPDTATARRAFPLYAGGQAVQHPGARAQPFLVEAERQARPEVERVLREGAAEAVAEVAAGVGG